MLLPILCHLQAQWQVLTILGDTQVQLDTQPPGHQDGPHQELHHQGEEGDHLQHGGGRPGGRDTVHEGRGVMDTGCVLHLMLIPGLFVLLSNNRNIFYSIVKTQPKLNPT